MAFTLATIDRLPRVYAIAATDEDGQTVTLASLDLAITEPRGRVDAATTWTTVPVVDGAATVILAGPDADDTDALVVPVGGGDLHYRWVDDTYVDTERIERITLA